MTLPLAGTTVVSLEQAVAAPFASRQLADLGARVIKIERVTGDFARGYDATVNGMSSYFVWLNRGKESVVLDLKDDEDMSVVRTLVSSADVLLQNLAPGAIERLGLGAEAAMTLNPRLIHASISGYGAGGTWEEKKAYDLLVQCEAGLLSVTGSPGEVAKVGISIADISAGMYAYTGILTSLLNREKTGRGDVIEISMLEALAEWMSQPLYYAMYSGEAPPRSGAHHASIAPYGPFQTRDGSVFLAVQNDREWAKLCGEILGDDSLAEDPRFATNIERVRHRDAVHAAVRVGLASRSAKEAQELLDATGIANARLRSMSDVADHPQLAERDRWSTVSSPVGELRALLPPVTSREISPAMGRIPNIGEHTEAVRREVLSARPAHVSPAD